MKRKSNDKVKQERQKKKTHVKLFRRITLHLLNLCTAAGATAKRIISLRESCARNSKYPRETDT